MISDSERQQFEAIAADLSVGRRRARRWPRRSQRLSVRRLRRIHAREQRAHGLRAWGERRFTERLRLAREP